MTDYDELVKALRCCGNISTDCTVCPWDKYNYGMCAESLYTTAAAAIEDLQAEVKRLELENEDYEYENRRLLDENEALRKNADEYLRDELEELKEQLSDADIAADDNGRQVEELQAEVAELKRVNLEIFEDLPKRGEWIVDGMYTYNLRELNGKAYEPVYRCSCCNRQMESYLRLDEPKMPEDADFPEYCPHCGAKMEVQDGQ